MVADLAPPGLRGRAFGWYHGAVGAAALPAGLAEMALLRSSQRVADVVAREPVEALVIDEAFLKRLRNRYPRVASRFFINIARILSDRLERANRRLALLG